MDVINGRCGMRFEQVGTMADGRALVAIPPGVANALMVLVGDAPKPENTVTTFVKKVNAEYKAATLTKKGTPRKEKACTICGAMFHPRTSEVTCAKAECKKAHKKAKNVQYRAKAKKADAPIVAAMTDEQKAKRLEIIKKACGGEA